MEHTFTVNGRSITIFGEGPIMAHFHGDFMEKDDVNWTGGDFTTLGDAIDWIRSVWGREAKNADYISIFATDGSIQWLFPATFFGG